MNKKGYRTKLTETQRQDIIQLYLNNESVENIMAKYDCSHGLIYHITKGKWKEKDYNAYLTLSKQFSAKDPKQLGWLAGIVDGEGFIGLTEIRQRGFAKWSGPRISVASTTRCMQEEIQTIFGAGNIYTTRKNSMRNQKIMYCWSLAATATIAAFLTVLQPLLVVKKKQGEVVRNFSLRRLNGDPLTQIDQDDIELIHQLNKRGRLPTTM